MGFPRIISKNNKVYTKLGEFCLSADGNHFWIVCHTCQEELQTQDHFWKHIQDEHNFLHDMKQETHSRHTSFMETETSATLMPLPLPLYRKVTEEEQHRVVVRQTTEAHAQQQQEPKDYAEMRAIEPNAVEVDIKVEPVSLAQTIAHQQQQQQQQQQAVAQAQVQAIANAPAGMYQLTQGHPIGAAPYSSIIATGITTLPTLNMPGAPPTTGAPMSAQETKHIPNNSAASASSAVSTEDGERWYVCDYETCGLKFKYQSRLELHRSVHSKVRRFACELCDASFKQSCNLSTHRKKKHALKGSRVLKTENF